MYLFSFIDLPDLDAQSKLIFQEMKRSSIVTSIVIKSSLDSYFDILPGDPKIDFLKYHQIWLF